MNVILLYLSNPCLANLSGSDVIFIVIIIVLSVLAYKMLLPIIPIPKPLPSIFTTKSNI